MSVASKKILKTMFLAQFLFQAAVAQHEVLPIENESVLRTFFSYMSINSDIERNDFIRYCKKEAARLRKKKRYLQEQALCELQLQKSALLDKLECTKDEFLCCYGVFMSYNKERVLRGSNTLNRLSSYVKDMTKVCASYFNFS